MMNMTSPNTPRIAIFSAVFGILALIIALWLFDFRFFGALAIGLIVAAIVGAFLWMRKDAPQNNASETSVVQADTPDLPEKPAVATKPAVTAMPVAVQSADIPAAVDKPAVAKPVAAKAKKAASGKPSVLAKARDGGPDDLKMIKGVGPVLEKALHTTGVFHFDQVAAWTNTDARWFDENVKGASGRVMRDAWIKQARILAKGGTTDFSSKVKKGGVY